MVGFDGRLKLADYGVASIEPKPMMYKMDNHRLKMVLLEVAEKVADAKQAAELKEIATTFAEKENILQLLDKIN